MDGQNMYLLDLDCQAGVKKECENQRSVVFTFEIVFREHSLTQDCTTEQARMRTPMLLPLCETSLNP